MSMPPVFTAALPPALLHELCERAAQVWPTRPALVDGERTLDHAALHAQVQRVAIGFRALGVQPGDRVAVWLDKRLETVIASFAATACGGVLVPVNPVLKPAQVHHVLADAGARLLVTSTGRHAALLDAGALPCEHVVLTDADTPQKAGVQAWNRLDGDADAPLPRRLDTDLAAIFYTSGSTGRPKGVMLSHRNLLAGAASVARYLGNREDDRLLAVLPLSFDAGFSQLTTAFLVGACVVLLNHLVPRDVLGAMARERITGLTAVPPLYQQLVALEWPAGATTALRYWANTGGRMPLPTLQQLRALAPAARPFLMYGLTEAFRSTYLPPDEADRRPDSIGRAIPNADIRVLREDGSECAVDEPGELVHRGPLVAMGYWQRPEETALRFRELPAWLGEPGERAVFSGDTVRRDAEGYLYFVSRRDEMIKTSGYRVSPTEVEEVVHASGLVAEAIAVGMDHSQWGQAIHVAAVPRVREPFVEAEASAGLLAFCRERLPAYMVPLCVHWSLAPLPRNPNGKLDRLAWRAQHGGGS
jgi:acyl-CoA ligase (AMP-forming) (exosortase A-associated)